MAQSSLVWKTGSGSDTRGNDVLHCFAMCPPHLIACSIKLFFLETSPNVSWSLSIWMSGGLVGLYRLPAAALHISQRSIEPRASDLQKMHTGQKETRKHMEKRKKLCLGHKTLRLQGLA